MNDKSSDSRIKVKFNLQENILCWVGIAGVIFAIGKLIYITIKTPGGQFPDEIGEILLSCAIMVLIAYVSALQRKLKEMVKR